MKYDFEKVLTDLSIDYKLRKSEVITIECPFCTGSGKSSHSMTGAFLYGSVYKCFRCGKHNILDVLIEKSTLSDIEINSILKKYYTTDIDTPFYDNKIEKSCITPFYGYNREIINYLTFRNFDAVNTINKYKLYSTSKIKDERNSIILSSYTILCNRLVIPVFDINGFVRSWTSRRMDTNNYIRYLSCPESCESLPIKSLLYNENLVNGDTVVVVEGAFDALKFGDGAVATMGTEVSIEQIEKLSKYNRVIIAFDPEKVAQEKALYIAKSIGTLTSVEILDISKYTLKKDFGDMNLEEINFFRNLTGFDLRSDKCVL